MIENLMARGRWRRVEGFHRQARAKMGRPL